MDYVQLVSNVGFPIAAFLLIYVDLRKIIKHMIDTNTKQHYEIIRIIGTVKNG